MHIKDNILNFLYDKKYFISIYDNYIHIFNYSELVVLTTSKVVLNMPDFKLSIKGDNLFITKMLPNELLIKGVIYEVGKEYV